MRPDIPESLRRFVIERAGNRCEYCLNDEDHITERRRLLDAGLYG